MKRILAVGIVAAAIFGSALPASAQSIGCDLYAYRSYSSLSSSYDYSCTNGGRGTTDVSSSGSSFYDTRTYDFSSGSSYYGEGYHSSGSSWYDWRSRDGSVRCSGYRYSWGEIDWTCH